MMEENLSLLLKASLNVNRDLATSVANFANIEKLVSRFPMPILVKVGNTVCNIFVNE